MSERVIRFFVPGFLLVYFLIGFSRWITYQHEIYPIGAWGMFHRVSKAHTDVDLVILRRGDRQFLPPVSARDPENPAGIHLDGHDLLVVNGFIRRARKEDLETAASYRNFIDRSIVGPDTEYEIHRILDRSRPSEYHRIRVERFGPFETDASLAQPDPEARFVFAESRRPFERTSRDTERRYKAKKSAK